MKVWNSEKKEAELKEPIIRLVDKKLSVVDNNGEHVANIFDFEVMDSYCSAREGLEQEGFRTDFAEWSDDGEMTKLLEPFDS